MTLTLAFIEGIGGPELLMIMFIILLLFGANKLPDLAKGLGKSVREFKKAASGIENEVRRAMEEPEEPLPKKFPAYPPSAGAIQQTATEKPVPPYGEPPQSTATIPQVAPEKAVPPYGEQAPSTDTPPPPAPPPAAC